MKKITKIEVIRPGSNPDVDTDFNTSIRDEVLAHVSETYGHENVANIITYNSLAAKSAFKTMCTIYQIPFLAANKIASLVPPPIEGVDCTIDDIFNPRSDRYAEGAEFRSATSGPTWAKIIDGARAIEGRYRSTGLHPCGVVISSRPLSEVLPLQVRQEDGRVITQWTYPECESVGLIKFDFLGLDTVDLIQHSVEYIMKDGKVPPNMVDLIHGEMNDKKTFAMLAKGETVGVFQLGSQIVQDFLKTMQPTEFEDIAASTALMRPGPMGMNSHTRYASRKNNREVVAALHPDFANSPLTKILGKTYGLCVYQEQVLKIANEIAGMTLQEGDELRSAMGKKKVAKMLEMKPKFFDGSKKNGYSEEAVNKLWDTIAEFAKYGFNKAHSVAYAMNAYQAAFLKANYPVEFMAALVSQNVGNKEKILAYLQEARRMNLKVGSVSINESDINVAPDYTHASKYDIVYGVSGVNSVSKDMAAIIISERDKNGLYKSVQDLINRCSPLGVTNRKIYENLALAGAFDVFGYSRKGVVEALPSMLGEAKTKTNFGTSLFDLFGEDDDVPEMDLTSKPEYPFVEKLQKEASVIGLYLTDHPLSRVGTGLSAAGVVPISKVMASTSTTTAVIVGSITDIEKKIRKQGGKTVTITVDDGKGYITANIAKDIVKGIDKAVAQDRIKRFYTTGETEVAKEIRDAALDDTFEAIPDLEKNAVYLMSITYRPPIGDGQYGARINAIKPLPLSDEGILPVRMRVPLKLASDENTLKARIIKFAEAVALKHPGDYPLYAAIITDEASQVVINENSYYESLIAQIQAMKPANTKKSTYTEATLFTDGKVEEEADNDTKKKFVRPLPQAMYPPTAYRKATEDEISERVVYFDTGVKVAKNTHVEEVLSNKFGAERVDFGVFNTSMALEGR